MTEQANTHKAVLASALSQPSKCSAQQIKGELRACRSRDDARAGKRYHLSVTEVVGF